jgi:8-oxo-dGTP pyrophosphatase MutT (NUDIX family)
MQLNPWKIVQEEIKYDNPWIRVSEFDVINPSGNKGIYGKVHFKNIAIGILPIDSEGYTYLVGQFRFPLEQFSWEIPEGGGKMDIDPLISAKRELLEETGLIADYWEPFLELHLSNSVSDEKALVFYASGLRQDIASPEETEQLDIKKIHINDAIDMVMKGEITDSISAAALLKWKALHP